MANCLPLPYIILYLRNSSSLTGLKSSILYSSNLPSFFTLSFLRLRVSVFGEILILLISLALFAPLFLLYLPIFTVSSLHNLASSHSQPPFFSNFVLCASPRLPWGDPISASFYLLVSLSYYITFLLYTSRLPRRSLCSLQSLYHFSYIFILLLCHSPHSSVAFISIAQFISRIRK